jgi:formylglycine-generating enzyme required for sulfatase activity
MAELANKRTVVGASILASLMVVTIGGSAASLPSSARHSLRPVVESPTTPEMTARIVDRSPCPRNMALVGASCVDRFEGSLLEVHEDGTETPFSPYAPPNGHRVRAVSRPDVVPQAHISMIEAKRACSASGKRLCRADEWKAACKGPDATRYPYGNTRVAHACVDTDRTAPMTVLHSGAHTGKTMNDPRANQQENTVEHTGKLASCTNGYGVHDMVGNVHEWTDDGSFRGGYYLDTKLNGEGCSYRTTAHAPAYYDYSTGFRCCADPGTAAKD